MKLAGHSESQVHQRESTTTAAPGSNSTGRTVRGGVQDHESRIHGRRELPRVPPDGVGMPSQAVLGLVEVDIVVCPVEGPERRDARAAAADDGYFLPGYMVN